MAWVVSLSNRSKDWIEWELFGNRFASGFAELAAANDNRIVCLREAA
jgi:hypothetical protein